MLYKALKTFSGLVTMVEGDVKDIPDKKVADDLLRSKYIEEIKVPEKTTKRGKKAPAKGD